MPREDNDHLECIDGIKGIACFIIAFFWHYRHFCKPPDVPFFNIFQVSYKYGYLLVELFFMLSGFGMMSGYGRRVLDHEITFPEYIMKRIKKLYPLFLLSTFIVIILEILIHHKAGEFFVYQNFDLYHLVLNLLLLQNGLLETGWSFNSPSWVISVLIILYALFYLICYHSKRSSVVYYLFAMCAILGCIIKLSDISGPLINELIGRGLSSFSVGVLMTGIYKQFDSFNSKRLGYFFLTFIGVTYFLLRTGRTYYVGNLMMLVIIGIAPMTLFCALSIPWISRLLSLKPFVLLGKISIAVYLLHFPVQCLIMCINDYAVPLSFSSCYIWMLYVFITLCLAGLYVFVISRSYESCLTAFFRRARIENS